MRKKLLAFAIGALIALAPVAAPAQNYPTRPVRIILPFAAGGVADITARVVAEKLGEELKQRFVVENQPGAGGITAARSALAATPDGYTLAMITNGTAISVPLFKSLPFDPLTDFAPISSLGYFDFVFGTNAESAHRTLPDLLKAMREQPGKLNVGTINIGSSQNLSAELFKSTAGIDFAIIPYRGTPEVVVSLLRNDVNMMIDSYAAMRSAISDGKIRAIATTGTQRSQSLAAVPTVAEAGVQGFDVVSWNALFVRAGTPDSVIQTLNAALQKVLASPDVKQRLLELGIEARASTPAEIHGRLRGDIDKWSKVIERSGIAKQ
jgi:tripartite-type tricarboxylate transporter receptor subunit TctC